MSVFLSQLFHRFEKANWVFLYAKITNILKYCYCNLWSMSDTMAQNCIRRYKNNPFDFFNLILCSRVVFADAFHHGKTFMAVQ